MWDWVDPLGLECTIKLYHGTSSSRASKIVGNEHKKTSGFREFTYLAEDVKTAEVFAFESLMKYPDGAQLPQSFSVIEFEIPKSEAKKLGLLERHEIGLAEGNPHVDVGTGYERYLSTNNLEAFNEGMRSGKIKTRRLKL